MKRYGVVALASLLGVGAIVGAGATAAAFGSQGSARSFERVAHRIKPNNMFRLRIGIGLVGF